MIPIPKNISGGFVEPSRDFNETEQAIIASEGGVIAQWGDENDCWFFTQADADDNTQDWQDYQAHLAQVVNDPPASSHLVDLLMNALEIATPTEKQNIRDALGI